MGTGGLGQVLPTHFHFDHWGALAEVVNRTEATTLAHPAATVGIPVPTGNAVRDGRFIVKGTPREKGVDVRCALTFVREARQPDIDLVILASHDSDLDPALDEAAALGMAKVETFCWVDPQRKPGRG
ncbi:NYN domain-containing protein [Pseudonocardia sp. K10HN5]|uniref:NYN domain-containing protein n=1 Tax=Pseudonocardia acidicola TaxID=2724939 RepID=A0ABX1SE39_9PSEU|nr:NYN domain-containing protein [Pseudonocardia acidicola]